MVSLIFHWGNCPAQEGGGGGDTQVYSDLGLSSLSGG